MCLWVDLDGYSPGTNARRETIPEKKKLLREMKYTFYVDCTVEKGRYLQFSNS
jgi:hypothetical protein